MSKEKTEKLYPDFVNEVSSLDVAAIKERIVAMQKHLEETEEHKANNEELKQARAAVSELAGPYNDTKKAIKAKTSYLVELLNEKDTK